MTKQTLSLCLCVSLFLGGLVNGRAQMVKIPDLELETVVREAIGKPTGDITAADMEDLQALDLSLIHI